MSETRVHALMVVRNEEDIVELCLRHASAFCTNIFVADNASTDRTWEIIQEVSGDLDPVVPVGRVQGVFYTIRPRVFAEMRDRFAEGDWILVLDADEFLQGDPRPLLERAARRGEDHVRSLFAQFAVTEEDLDAPWFESDGPVRGFQDLPRHYRMDWEENRLFRYSEKLSWPEREADGSIRRSVQPVGANRSSRDRMVTRHYQYRSRRQMMERLRIRAGLHESRGYFRHNADVDWQSYVRRADKLKRVEPDERIEVTWWEAQRSRWRRERPLRRLVRGVRRRIGG